MRTSSNLGRSFGRQSTSLLGYTPDGLIAEIRRNANYPDAEWRSLQMDTPIQPDRILKLLRSALVEAENFVSAMPTQRTGLLFLRAGRVVQPDPAKLDSYEMHRGARQGHWPSSGEITSATLERLREKTPLQD